MPLFYIYPQMLTDSSEEASVYVVSLQLLHCPCQGADVHDVATDIFEVYRKVYTSNNTEAVSKPKFRNSLIQQLRLTKQLENAVD